MKTLLLASLLICGAAFAASPSSINNDDSCDIKVGPAATLLLPYFEVDVNGTTYKATLGADKRPERIEAMVTMPGGGSKKLVASYADYRTGEKPDAGFGLAEGKEALDKYHSGTYWPSRITHDVDGMKVLDLTISEGWANPYVVFPDPELLAKAQ